MNPKRKDWRSVPGAASYAQGWGFRPGSAVAKLIDFVREERRAKYGTDYRLERIGKNRFRAVPGDKSDYGVLLAINHSSQFEVVVL